MSTRKNDKQKIWFWIIESYEKEKYVYFWKVYIYLHGNFVFELKISKRYWQK